MSRTDKDAPYRVRARDSHMREEWHVWCDNETVDTASPWKYGRFARRAEYERYITGYRDEEVTHIVMIDENKCRFKAEVRYLWRRVHEYIYDHEEHPGAKPVMQWVWYGGERVSVNIYSREWVKRPTYRRRLIRWIEEPLRECDIDSPNGVCHYNACDLKFPYENNRELRRVVDEKPRRAKARDVLNEARHDYNTYGETDIEPEPGWSSRAWW